MNVSIVKLRQEAILPAYQTAGSAAADISACIDDSRVLHPGEISIVPTGLSMAIPSGYEIQIRARSGLSSKHGVCLANGVATIDSDYRGEIGVILINLGQKPFVVESGMRIAQIVLAEVTRIDWHEVDQLELSERTGGYGSTGH